jgi:hypothetical protein
MLGLGELLGVSTTVLTEILIASRVWNWIADISSLCSWKEKEVSHELSWN